VPHELSRIVAPSDFFATALEKQAVRDYQDSERELAAAERELAASGSPR
jgi:hypothetical protein